MTQRAYEEAMLYGIIGLHLRVRKIGLFLTTVLLFVLAGGNFLSSGSGVFSGWWCAMMALWGVWCHVRLGRYE